MLKYMRPELVKLEMDAVEGAPDCANGTHVIDYCTNGSNVTLGCKAGGIQHIECLKGSNK